MRSMGPAELLHSLVGGPWQLQHDMYTLLLVLAALFNITTIVNGNGVSALTTKTHPTALSGTLSACSEIPIEAASLTMAMSFFAFMNRFLGQVEHDRVSAWSELSKVYITERALPFFNVVHL